MPIPAPATPLLFSADDLSNWMDIDVSAGRAQVIEGVVWGWVRPILNQNDRPSPVPPDLFSAAVELGAIAFENPTGLASYQLGEERSQYSFERRTQILDEIKARLGTAGNVDGLPAASFPAPPVWSAGFWTS